MSNKTGLRPLGLFVSSVLFICLHACGEARICAQQTVTKPETPERTAEQIAALTEASRLSARVVQLYSQGKLNEALPLAQRAISLRQKNLGADDPLLADAFANLAALYLNNDFEKAESSYKRALAIYDKAGVIAQNVPTVLDSLTLLRLVRHDLKQAEVYGQRALALKEKTYGPEHSEIAQTLTNLIKVYEAQDRPDKTSPLYLRLIAMMEKRSEAVPDRISKLLFAYDCSLLSRKQTAELVDLENRIEALFSYSKQASDQSTAIEAGVLNGRAICLPRPIYPSTWGRGHIEGSVVVRVIVDQTGKVIDAKAIGGPPELMNVSENAALRARFTPTIIGGKPARVQGSIIYKFGVR